jgi:RsiW-degrading membrane proteinase PrsW (M82 family)
MPKLIESFFLGFLAAFGSLVVEFFLYSLGENLPVSTWRLAIFLFIGRAFIEEIFKFAIIYKKIGSLPSRGILLLNSAFVGLGFAATEFLLLYSKSGIKLINDLKPLAGVALVHIITALIAGYIISANRHGKLRIIWKIIAINLLIHLAYNFLALERIL